jgi:hypothetical protein
MILPMRYVSWATNVVQSCMRAGLDMAAEESGQSDRQRVYSGPTKKIKVDD